MKVVKFHPDAESEMIDTAIYYEAQQSDLGRRFLAVVQDAVNRILLNSHLYPVVELNVQQCLTKTFPLVSFSERCLTRSSSWQSCTYIEILNTGRTDRI